MFAASATFSYNPRYNPFPKLKSTTNSTFLIWSKSTHKGQNLKKKRNKPPTRKYSYIQPSHGRRSFLCRARPPSFSWTSAQRERQFSLSGGSRLWGLESCSNCISLVILLEWWYDANQVPGNLAKETLTQINFKWIRRCSQVNRMYLSEERSRLWLWTGDRWVREMEPCRQLKFFQDRMESGKSIRPLLCISQRSTRFISQRQEHKWSSFCKLKILKTPIEHNFH